MEINKDYYISKGKAVYLKIDSAGNGIPSILVSSVQSFSDGRAAEAGASLAYYALFSIFPLLIFIVGFATSFLADEEVQKFIFEFLQTALPSYFLDLIEGNIERAIALRGPVQIIGTIGLLWAASGVFTGLTRNIDRAWKLPRERNFILGRLIGIGMIAALATGLVLLWFISTTLINILPLLKLPLGTGESIQIYDTLVWRIFSRLIPMFLLFFTFTNIYRWVPNTTVRWREAAWGAVVATLGWEFAQRGFSWYLTSGLAKYQLVYGSLGAVIAFMLWLYVCALIVLYGAYLSASVAYHTRLKEE